MNTMHQTYDLARLNTSDRPPNPKYISKPYEIKYVTPPSVFESVDYVRVFLYNCEVL